MLRPMTLDRASVINPASTTQPLEIPILILTYEQWQYIPVKYLGSTIPTRVYYETSDPIGVLHYWPYPTSDIQAVIYVAQQLLQIPSLDYRIALPPGYLRALQYNLAVELADRFPRANLKPASIKIAAEAKAWIKRRNTRPIDIQVDRAVLPWSYPYNIYTDQYSR
jgi:hypothetical protein